MTLTLKQLKKEIAEYRAIVRLPHSVKDVIYLNLLLEELERRTE